MKLALLSVLAVIAVAGLLVWRSRRRREVEPGRGPLADVPAIETLPELVATPAPVDPVTLQDTTPLSEDSAQEIGADFYEEVVHLLEAELQGSPQRSDLRFKLLEMYAATHRRAEFLALAQRHRASEAGTSDPYWPRIAEAGRQLLPGETLFAESAALFDLAERDATLEMPRKFRRYYDSVNAEKLGALATELHTAFQDLRQAASFWKRLRTLHTEFVGTRAPVVHVEKLSSFVGGAQIYVRHDTGRPGSEASTLGALGQALLAQAMGRRCLVAAPAAEGHALAVARAAHKLGLDAQLVVTAREQAHRKDELQAFVELGGRVVHVADGAPGARMESQRAALERALEHGAALYVSPIEAGPFPYPVIVQELQSLAGRDLKSQVSALAGRAPDGIIVSTADGMAAIGVLQAFLAGKDTQLYCVQAGGARAQGPHRLAREHAWLQATGRIRYSSVPEEVARFAARHCMPDGIGDLQLSGGEVLVETFTLSRQFSPHQVVAVVIPAEPASAPAESTPPAAAGSAAELAPVG